MLSRYKLSHVASESKPPHHAKSKMNETFCDLCSICVPNKASLKAHLDGQKHKRNVSKQEEWTKKANSSLYVSGIKRLPIAELALADYFSAFSNVKKITIDKTLKHYAIVEVEDPSAVKKILEQRHHVVNGVSVVVKPREVKSSVVHATSSKNANLNVKEEALDQHVVDELVHAMNVDQQILSLQDKLHLTVEDISLRDLLCQLLQSALQEAFPGCSIRPFGSSSNGFGVGGCDLDLHFEYDKVHPDVLHDILSQDEEMETSDKKLDFPPKTVSADDILLAVAEIIKQCVPDCHKIKAILTARLPVVRFHHKASKMKCDISLANHIAVRNTEYLRFCWQLQPAFRSLVFVVRAWMKQWELAGGIHANGPRLNNYAVTLLVLFYMQHTEQIPSLEEMRSNISGPRTIINGWDCTFPSQVHNLRSRTSVHSRSLKQNLAQFFEFYSNVDFAKTVLDLSIAKFVPTSNLSTKDCELTASSNYLGSIGKSSEDVDLEPEVVLHEKSKSFKVGPLNIRDPFELFHNVAGNVNEKHVKLMTKCIRNAVLASRMNAYHVKPQGNQKWGILNLFIDHHHKKNDYNVKESFAPGQEYAFSIRNTTKESNLNVAVAGGLVLTVLRDIFMISCKNVNDLSPTENMASEVVPENAVEVAGRLSADWPVIPACDHASTDDNVAIGVSRKRPASPEPCGYCKRAKLMLSSPTAHEVFSHQNEPIKFPCTVECLTTHKLWQGRRKARRQLVQKGKFDLFALEKQVSELLLSDQADSSQSSEMNISQESNSSTSSSSAAPPVDVFPFTLTLKSEVNYSLQLVFRPDSKSSDFVTFYRHLEAFLPGFVVKCMKQ